MKRPRRRGAEPADILTAMGAQISALALQRDALEAALKSARETAALVPDLRLRLAVALRAAADSEAAALVARIDAHLLHATPAVDTPRSDVKTQAFRDLATAARAINSTDTPTQPQVDAMTAALRRAADATRPATNPRRTRR